MYLTSDESGKTRPAVPCGPDLRAALRVLGVRTASDLVDLTRRGRAGELCVDELAGAVEKLLPEYERVNIRQRLCLLITTLDRSEWLGRIENWRRSAPYRPTGCGTKPS